MGKTMSCRYYAPLFMYLQTALGQPEDIARKIAEDICESIGSVERDREYLKALARDYALKTNYERLLNETRQNIRDLYEQTEDKYCDGCSDLKITPPHYGPTTCDMNSWRDLFKCNCSQYNMVWLHGKKTNVPRIIYCILDCGKEG